MALRCGDSNGTNNHRIYKREGGGKMTRSMAKAFDLDWET